MGLLTRIARDLDGKCWVYLQPTAMLGPSRDARNSVSCITRCSFLEMRLRNASKLGATPSYGPINAGFSTPLLRCPFVNSNTAVEAGCVVEVWLVDYTNFIIMLPGRISLRRSVGAALPKVTGES